MGNTTNVDDDTNYGAVPYTYLIGKNEVSEAMIDAYNTANPSIQITKDTRGADKPATSVSWNEAARFVNWLNTSQGYQAAYKFTNDNFADRRSLGNQDATTTGSNVGATGEAGEPDHASPASTSVPLESVWWSWTAPEDGNVTISTAGSSFDTTLGVYTGTSVGALTEVASNDDDGQNITSLVTFSVIAGTSYAVAVDGFRDYEGDVALSVDFDGAATNVPFTEANAPIALWTPAEAWQQGGVNLYRHKDAKYFLPSEDEWYKAAYYDPNKGGAGVGGYWDYATGSDSAPTAVASGTGAGTAVYGQTFGTGPADITNAGGLSPYGTMAQNGNVFEWCESASTAPNDSAVESRVRRGGFWNGFSTPCSRPPHFTSPARRAQRTVFVSQLFLSSPITMIQRTKRRV